MANPDRPEIGTITWADLTVPNASEVRQFYHQVVGWKSEPVDMDGYNDFNMNTPGSGDTVAGICHARGNNAGMPAQWLVYITVEDVDASIAKCKAMSGKVIVAPKGVAGQGRFCVIQDPAGAVVALFEFAKR